MSDDIKDTDLEDQIERANEDGILGRFIAVAIHEHCDDERHAIQFLTSLIINMGANDMLCPDCFVKMVTGVTEEVFERVELEDGMHESRMKDASVITDVIIGEETKH